MAEIIPSPAARRVQPATSSSNFGFRRGLVGSSHLFCQEDKR